MVEATSRHWLRDREGDESAEVTYVELFFDLVFVFAITQLSHYLIDNLTAEGAMRALLLFLAVWWVWIYTSWVTNWLDPERTPVRLLIFALMLAGLMMSIALPGAFEDRGLAFALAYVAMQVGRSFFMVWALILARHDGRINFQRVAVWLLLSGAFWIAGAFAEGDARFGLWTLAVGIELLSPSIGFWLPGLGRASPEDWDVEGPHFAERCGLFIIIALGESLLLTGATLEEHEFTPANLAGLVAALATAVTMWWIYFDTGARRGERALERSETPGRLAQIAYTYLHMPIVAGIVVTAVGDEKVLADPLGVSDWGVAATILGGPALFLLGNLLFKMAVAGRLPLSHLAGLVVLLALALAPWVVEPLLLSWGSTVALLVVAALEWRLARSRTAAAAKVT
ncbi:low temperature requirement protein A [Rubellimicrobium aerolatum]|uniref:Low temperature requirement protein A n=1 Tax=Rubellimicrobium aerolatum TaxID=490979 RepID=A0ABW0SFN5_9RHOB|nr:low temperature requirement protein A [Rubellimicrobium aerolatum]MBP1807287.1 low temperature requirement protein LtrA [Rubellimicrobium aerolatum]